MSDKQVSDDFEAVLAKVHSGAEVIVEQNRQAVAIIRSASPQVRLLSESIAIAEARTSNATLDEGFMKDVDEGIAGRSQPWTPPIWD